jgi:hypothetical protein
MATSLHKRASLVEDQRVFRGRIERLEQDRQYNALTPAELYRKIEDLETRLHLMSSPLAQLGKVQDQIARLTQYGQCMYLTDKVYHVFYRDRSYVLQFCVIMCAL